MRVEKAWGFEEILVNEPEYCAKRLHISPGKKCSLHYHEKKKETFYIESGVVRLENSAYVDFLYPGGMYTIVPGTSHRFSSVEGAVILEISTHHDDADVIRLEPSGEI